MSTIEQRAKFVERVNTVAAEEGAEFAASVERHPDSEGIKNILLNSLMYVSRTEYDGVLPLSHIIAVMLDWSRDADHFRRDSDLRADMPRRVEHADGYAGAVGHLLGLIDARGLKMAVHASR